MINDLIQNGYLKARLPKNCDLIGEIEKLRKEKNAIILAHYYQPNIIQDLADYLGDSLQLAREAQKTNAEMIVFCGVHFMAETAKILNPTKKVVLPDLKAGCSLADSCTAEGLREMKEKHPKALVVSYINCSSEVKAESDVIVTSSNAEHIIRTLPPNQEILFVPDRNLGDYINQKTGRNMILWDGACMLHEAFSKERVLEQLKNNPNAKLIVHPEAKAPLINIAAYTGSTSGMLKYVIEDNATEYIVATESGILHEMQKKAPAKRLIPAETYGENCNCNECSFMKLTNLEKLYLCMQYELPEITIQEELRLKALRPLEKMLEISKSIK